jgi:hypothetical protein
VADTLTKLAWSHLWRARRRFPPWMPGRARSRGKKRRPPDRSLRSERTRQRVTGKSGRPPPLPGAAGRWPAAGGRTAALNSTWPGPCRPACRTCWRTSASALSPPTRARETCCIKMPGNTG